MIIAGYLKTSLIEWPGKIASIVFTYGCNFNCPYCHNRDLVGDGSTQINDRFTQIDQKEILKDIKKRKKWIDAVVITGGEPTLQGDLIEFIKLIKLIEGMKVMVETNGSRPEIIGKLIRGGLVDYWTMDLKGDLDNYPQFARMQKSPPKADRPLVEKIKTSVGLIAGSGVEYEFRTTVVPGIHNLENLVTLAKEIREVAEGVEVSEVSKGEGTKFQVPNNKQIPNSKYQITNTQYPIKWFVQQFRPVNCLDKGFLKKNGFTKEEMEGFLVELKMIVPNTYLRGI